METKEKMDTDSIVVKPEYASSEYSTEAPPVSWNKAKKNLAFINENEWKQNYVSKQLLSNICCENAMPF